MKLALRIVIDRTSPWPLAEQIVEQIVLLVAVGFARPDDELPGAERMAAEVGVSKQTMQHAYQVLQSYGIVVSRPGSSTVVAAASAPAARQLFARRLCAGLMTILRALPPPINRDEMRTAYLAEEARYFGRAEDVKEREA